MNGTIVLNWLPIAAAVGLGAATWGRPHAYLAGAIGAAYWVAASLFDPAHPVGGDASGAAVLAGGVLLLMAIASGLASLARPRPFAAPPAGPPANATTPDKALSPAEIVVRFDEWMATNRTRPDPWPDFGEFVTNVLFLACGGQHVRAYRLLSEDDEQLYPLRRTEPEERDFPNARLGLLGHVLTTRRSYYANDPAHGSLVEELAAGCAWCFPIQQNRRPIGVVRVGALDAELAADLRRLQLVEGLLTLCWTGLAEACRSRFADHIDPVSGVLTHKAYMDVAELALVESYHNGEPVAVVNLSVEGLRRLADNGRWDLSNQVLFEISAKLKERLREDDEIGVFDGTRFLLLLRRVDSALAMLIVRQLMEKLAAICSDQDRWGGVLAVRCGVAGSGIRQPTLRTLISRATAKCQEAREQGRDIAADLPATTPAVTARPEGRGSGAPPANPRVVTQLGEDATSFGEDAPS